MKATITISKSTRLYDLPALKTVKKELRRQIKDLLPYLTHVNIIETLGKNHWETVEFSTFEYVGNVEVELSMFRGRIAVTAEFWIRGFLNGAWSIGHLINYADWHDDVLDFDIEETGGT